ncbi:flagellar basal body P-ring formation chaperone FlgA [Pseudothermotoga thermarum]|nr:flagellar basal body P-ring formation chaperone FlgA [Pseudothermotoga thermarum]
MRRSSLLALLIFIFCVAFSSQIEDSIKKAVEDYLVSNFGNSIKILSFDINTNLENVDDFEILSHFVNRDDVRILLKLLNNGKILGYCRVNLKVVDYRKVVVARRIIKSGQVIQPEDVKIVELNVFGKRGNFAEKMEDVVGKVSRKMFREDEPIDLFYVVQPPDVKAGEILTAVVQLDGLIVTALVRLMHDAYFGDVVRARNLSTGFLIQGILGTDYKIYVSGS